MQALIVIDAQNEFSQSGQRAVPNHSEAIEVIQARVDEARREGRPIAWVRHFNRPNESIAFKPGTWGAEFCPGLGPKAGREMEVEFQKEVYGAFTGSKLGNWLKDLAVDDVLILGFYTHGCLSTTAREAIMLGLNVSIDPSGTGACDLAHELLGTLTADEVRRSSLLQLAGIGVRITPMSSASTEHFGSRTSDRWRMLHARLKTSLLLLLFVLCGIASIARAATLRHGWQEIDGVHLFYREGGDPNAPAIVFLHGNPLSSIMYEKVMEELSAADDPPHVIAVDYPSFGYSDAPDHTKYQYTFDHIAETVGKFLKARGVTRYGLYMQDYGVPIGFRLISATPSAITMVIVQNGVIHLDGFPAAQDANAELRRHWSRRNPALDQRRANYTKAMVYPQAANWIDDNHIGPDVALQMTMAAQRPGVIEARNDLWFNYGTNLERYPAWQAMLRKMEIPVLVIWGSQDTFFTTPGAIAYLRDVPRAEVHLLDTDHFATLTKPDEVARLVGDFLARHRDSLLPVEAKERSAVATK
jgi:pimeloyl-ACP methyl ester carboxylesterase/nicotinamidase-related amidase